MAFYLQYISLATKTLIFSHFVQVRINFFLVIINRQPLVNYENVFFLQCKIPEQEQYYVFNKCRKMLETIDNHKVVVTKNN